MCFPYQTEAWGQGSYLIAIHMSVAILVCNKAVNGAQWTDGSGIAFVKLNDLEIVDKVMVKYISCAYSLLKKNWTVWSMSRACMWGCMFFCIWLEALSMQLRVKESSCEWKDMHFFILIPCPNCVSNKRIQFLMIQNCHVWGTESLKGVGESASPWASLSSCLKIPGLCWLCPPHVQKLFPTMQFGFCAPWIS